MDRTVFETLVRKERIQNSNFPHFQTPMLATLTKKFFDHPDWIYERKFDGMRCLTYKQNDKVQLYSRNGNLLNHSFPNLAEQIPNLSSSDFVADGEIVAFEGKTTSFKKLQNLMQIKNPQKARNIDIKAYLYIFDLLYFDAYDLQSLTLIERKEILKEKLLWKRPIPIQYTIHRREHGLQYHTEACQKGWEGIIAKNGTAPYRHTRSRNWLKFKCINGQELVIGGFTEPRGQRKGFGSLLVGFYKNGALRYAGKVGTGFSDEFLREWRRKFDEIETKDSPFSDYSVSQNGINHWIEPKHVGQFEFTEWTASNKLRHPSFLGIRNDKPPKKVIKET